jgi:hypothetical protein
MPQSFHRMFDDTFVIALRRSQISKFDKLRDHRARRDAETEGQYPWGTPSELRNSNRFIRTMGASRCRHVTNGIVEDQRRRREYLLGVEGCSCC